MSGRSGRGRGRVQPGSNVVVDIVVLPPPPPYYFYSLVI